MNPKLILAAALLIVAAGMGCVEEPPEKITETAEPEPFVAAHSIQVDRQFEYIEVRIYNSEGWSWTAHRSINPNLTVVLEDGTMYTCDPPSTLDYAPFYDEIPPLSHPTKYIDRIPFWDLYAMNDSAIMDYCMEQDRLFWENLTLNTHNIDDAKQAEIDRQMMERSPNPPPESLVAADDVLYIDDMPIPIHEPPVIVLVS